MPRLIAMMGLPRSGKSTIVRDLYLPQGYAIVGGDEIRLALHGQRYVQEAEPIVAAIAGTMVDALLRAGNNVLVDETNVTAARRARWLRRGAEMHVVPTSAEVCIQRAEKMNDKYIIPVIERMAQEWQPFEIQEVYDAQRSKGEGLSGS